MHNSIQTTAATPQQKNAPMMLKYPAHLNSRFFRLLNEFDFDQLQSDAGTIYGLWPDLTLAYTNPAWSRFASDNGSEGTISGRWSMGCNVIDAIAQPLRAFYIKNYDRCLSEGRPWEHSYACTAANQDRMFHTIVFPLGAGEGLLVVNSLQVDLGHGRISRPPMEAQYRNRSGIINQCCHCRRIRRVGEGPIWDWIPAWARRNPVRTSHGLCAACSGFYYAEARWNLKSVIRPFSTICA
jgi:hypothetical protein